MALDRIKLRILSFEIISVLVIVMGEFFDIILMPQLAFSTLVELYRETEETSARKFSYKLARLLTVF